MEHPNLVKLIGYCALDDERGIQRLLVYEYMPNKSLEFHLFNKAYDPLPWKTRLEIATGAAQGLTYLHEELEIQVPVKAILSYTIPASLTMWNYIYIIMCLHLSFKLLGIRRNGFIVPSMTTWSRV